MKHINLSNYKGSITDWTILNYVKGGLADNLADIANIKVNDSCYNYLAKSQNLSPYAAVLDNQVLVTLQAGTYTISFNVTTTNGGVNLRKNAIDGDIIKSIYINSTYHKGTFTLQEKTTIYFNGFGGGWTNYNIMLNEGSTALPYEPYGALVIHQNAGIVDLGSLDWNYNPSYGTTAQGAFYCPTDIGAKQVANDKTFNGNCAKYEATSRDYIWYNQTDKKICLTGGILVTVVDKDYTNAQAFKAAMSGVMLKYELANPQIIILKSVDLGTLNYQLEVRTGRNIFKTTISDIMPQASKTVAINASCPLYRPVSNAAAWVDKDMAYAGDVGSTQVSFVNNDYNNVADFKAAMNGVILLYEPASTSSTVTTLSMSNELNETEFNDNVEELDNFEESTIKEES